MRWKALHPPARMSEDPRQNRGPIRSDGSKVRAEFCVSTHRRRWHTAKTCSPLPGPRLRRSTASSGCKKTTPGQAERAEQNRELDQNKIHCATSNHTGGSGRTTSPAVAWPAVVAMQTLLIGSFDDFGRVPGRAAFDLVACDVECHVTIRPTNRAYRMG
jgi:hypothetical protein